VSVEDLSSAGCGCRQQVCMKNIIILAFILDSEILFEPMSDKCIITKAFDVSSLLIGNSFGNKFLQSLFFI